MSAVVEPKKSNRITATRGRDGAPDMVVVAPVKDDRQSLSASPEQSEGQTHQSLAEWLLSGEELPKTERLDIEGAPRPFYIKRLDLSDSMVLGALSGGRIDFNDAASLDRLGAACLFVGVATDEAGKMRLFPRWEDALKATRSTAERAVETNSILFGKVLALNPNIIKKES